MAHAHVAKAATLAADRLRPFERVALYGVPAAMCLWWFGPVLYRMTDLGDFPGHIRFAQAMAATGRVTIPSGPTAANLAWTGRFYVPVHFQDDAIDWELVVAGQADSRFLSGPSVVLVEVRE